MFQLWMKACVLNNFYISLQLDPILIYLWISFYYHLQHPLIQHVCESDHGSHRQGHLEPSSKSARRRRSHLSLCHSQCRNGLVEIECRSALVAEHGKCYELDLIILTTRRDKLGKKTVPPSKHPITFEIVSVSVIELDPIATATAASLVYPASTRRRPRCELLCRD